MYWCDRSGLRRTRRLHVDHRRGLPAGVPRRLVHRLPRVLESRQPTGYKVVRLPLDGNRLPGPLEDFANGWLDPSRRTVSGRPVGLAVGPDGALYVSEDKAGLIYRINYRR